MVPFIVHDVVREMDGKSDKIMAVLRINIKPESECEFLNFSVRMIISICFLLMNSQLWSQEKPEKFVIRTYGFPPIRTAYDEIVDSIHLVWNIDYRFVAGCIVTDEFTDSISQLNNLTYQRLDNFYGKDWRERLIKEIDSSYNLLLIKNENTYETIANCSNENYYFQVRRNLSSKQTKIEIVDHQAKNKRKNSLTITGLQNKDPHVVYRGYVNKLELEFNSSEDTLYLSLRTTDPILIKDSCLDENKLHFTYFATSLKDTLFIETSSGENIQFIFNAQNLHPPVLTLNDQRLDSSFYRKQLKKLNQLGSKFQDDALLDGTFKVESWEVIVAGLPNTFKGSGNIIPAEVSKELKKLPLGTTITLQTTVKGPDSVLRKKSATFKLI